VNSRMELAAGGRIDSLDHSVGSFFIGGWAGGGRQKSSAGPYLSLVYFRR